MLRPFVCAVLALGFTAGIGRAEPPRRFPPFRPPVNFPQGGDAKRGAPMPGGKEAGGGKKDATKQVRGTVSAVDADAGTITVSVGKGDEAKAVDFTVGEAKIVAGKNTVKLTDLKSGSAVIVLTGGDGKTVKQIVVTGSPKKE